MVNQSMVNKFNVNELTVLKKVLLIMNDNSSHCSVEFFQFVRDQNTDLV